MQLTINKNARSRFNKLPLLCGSIIAISIYTIYLLINSSTAPATNAAVVPISCTNPHTTVTCLELSIPTSTVDINLTPTPSGTIATNNHTVNTKTNAPGYNLTLSTNSSTSNSLAHNPVITPTNATIAPTSGTPTTPAVLGTNSWGYSNTGTGYTWSAVPTSPSPATIKTTSIANDTTGDNTTIYYGAKVNTALPSGIYQGTVVYTAMPKPFPAPTIATTNGITPNSGPIAGGTTITITGTNFYDLSTITIDGNPCTIQPTPTPTPTSIACITPVGTAGAKNVTLTTAHGTVTATNGFTYQAPTITAIVPSVASTIAPTSDGTNPGPQFSMVGTNLASLTASQVKIGNNACKEITTNSAGTALTCTGPTTGLTAGAQTVTIDTTPQTGVTVTYNSTNYPTLQSLTGANCTGTATTPAIYRDTRDSQLYYVAKLQDNKCWMLDNLRYKPNGSTMGSVTNSFAATQVANASTTNYLTVDGTNSTTAPNQDAAKYVDPMPQAYCYGTTNISAENITKCGLLYNFYTATAGTGTQSIATNGTQASGSICPANWRLPSGRSGTGGPTTDGTSYSAADFPVLNASMNAGALTTGSITSSYQANWLFSGAWRGVYSGDWDSGLASQGGYGGYWSSTTYSATNALGLAFSSGSVSPPSSGTDNRYRGWAVRCVISDPPPPPPAVTAITPNSGHYLGGETVNITGSGFTGATTVKVGGNTCRSNVVNSDTSITCVVAGATDTDATTTATTIIQNSFMTSATSAGRSVSVTAPTGTSAPNALWTYRYPNSSFTTQGTYLHILGTDITNGSIATVGGSNLLSQQIVDGTHMTGVSPALGTGAKTVTIGNTVASQGNMQNFNCSAIATPAHTTTDWSPYTRVLTDTRDGKMYRIRKLPDGHCWMIDNLKLGGTGSAITLTAANTNIKTNPGGQTSFVLPANPIVSAATKLSNGRCDASGLTNTSGTYLTCKGASPTAPAVTTAKTDQPDDDLRFAGYVDPADVANTIMSQNCRPGAPFINSASLSGCGYLYNWYTATAGIGNYTWPADTSTNANATTSDICPAGWHLPKSGFGNTTGNEFATLNGAMLNGGAASITSNATTRPNWRSSGPFAGAYSGSWFGGFLGQGYYGNYWSSSASSATDAGNLYFFNSNVNPGNTSNGKYYGVSVRCVL